MRNGAGHSNSKPVCHFYFFRRQTPRLKVSSDLRCCNMIAFKFKIIIIRQLITPRCGGGVLVKNSNLPEALNKTFILLTFLLVDRKQYPKVILK